jgi:DNA-directed RNA polymerase subunit F
MSKKKREKAADLDAVNGVKKNQRINLAFQHEALEYLRIMSGFDSTSITQYINKLISEDKAKRKELFHKLVKLRETEK